jgi:catechol 2,3-dioxygenase-like lactoylglutathione lyase family enzyme
MDLGWFEVGLNVREIAQSLAFYRTLGFEVVDGKAETRSMILQKGDCRIALYQGFGGDPLYLQFCQGDVARIARELTGKGLRFEKGPGNDDAGASALLRDPDGNALFFINSKKYETANFGSARQAPAGPLSAPHEPPKKSRGFGMDLGWFEVSIPVGDIARSREFYRKLGFRVADDSIERNATLQNGDCRLSLYQGYLDPARSQLIYWQGDVEAIANDLTGKGLRFGRAPASDEKGTGAMLFDPDGNPLYFVNIKGVTRQEPA